MNFENADILNQFWIREWDVHRLVFIDGVFQKKLSSETTFIHEDTITVPTGVKMAKPVHAVYVATGSNPHTSHNVVLNENSELDFIEEYTSLDGVSHDNDISCRFLLKENAKLQHSKIQSMIRQETIQTKTEIHLSEKSSYKGISFCWGAQTSLDDLSFFIEGKNVKVLVSGLLVGKDNQQLDQRLVMDHKVGYGESYQHFKCILKDKARGLFDGKIYVRPDAQKTSAHQSNDNLLLSDDAVSRARPHLEIYADDVKCTHGSATGQMDDDSLFYIRSRGIDEKEARKLLIEAFANEIIQDLPWAPLQGFIKHRLEAVL